MILQILGYVGFYWGINFYWLIINVVNYICQQVIATNYEKLYVVNVILIPFLINHNLMAWWALEFYHFLQTLLSPIPNASTSLFFNRKTNQIVLKETKRLYSFVMTRQSLDCFRVLGCINNIDVGLIFRICLTISNCKNRLY